MLSYFLSELLILDYVQHAYLLTGFLKEENGEFHHSVKMTVITAKFVIKDFAVPPLIQVVPKFHSNSFFH